MPVWMREISHKAPPLDEKLHQRLMWEMSLPQG
ncbi:rCG46937 [Rattus norvegicus]|uniref:RCG46937 n=1 Tax=Rattus norvegicus TaxID=10116 RepID=A6IXG9_RAT|nr:rCG46937 [Rattus norvegicus]